MAHINGIVVSLGRHKGFEAKLYEGEGEARIFARFVDAKQYVKDNGEQPRSETQA
jgi:hypothetical protein